MAERPDALCLARSGCREQTYGHRHRRQRSYWVEFFQNLKAGDDLVRQLEDELLRELMDQAMAPAGCRKQEVSPPATRGRSEGRAERIQHGIQPGRACSRGVRRTRSGSGRCGPAPNSESLRDTAATSARHRLAPTPVVGGSRLGGEDITVKFWGQPRGKVSRQPRVATGLVSSVAFTPDGRFLISESRDETVKVWDLRQLGRKPRD